MKYALIDMGSNSIRLTVYDMDRTSFKVLFKEKIMAGLAGYVEHGRLTRDGIDCACQSLRKFQNTLELLQIERLAVFATASLRNISNTSQAVDQIRCVTGISVEVLTGETEAECGFYGAACDVETDNSLFADIGGASAELALFTDQELQEAVSVPVGSLKLYRDCVKKILPGKKSRQRIEETIQTAFGGGLKNIPPREHLICVGGTARACLRLSRKLFGLPENQRTFTRAQLDSLTKQLCKCDKNAADLILRYEPERIHTLVPGIMILRYLVNRFAVEDITVSHYGVREGYLRRKIQPSLLAEQVS
ncbi:MAG: hypothetical protein Q4C48_10585 [Lachnospiraceae bacterium]|nr:hypothetical protein [Lachnospiraceae bacterium]